jgi:phage baseplate assembly protein W
VSAFSFPFAIGADGSTLQPTRAAHVRQMIEQVLFTRRGERVNRPDFGAGVSELLFSENAPELAAAAQHMVQASLQQWLGHLIEVLAVDTGTKDSTLSIVVRYRLREDGSEASVQFGRLA